MLLSMVVTGEGISDVGKSNNAQPVATGDAYNVGPMALLICRQLASLLPDWNLDCLNLEAPAPWVTCVKGIHFGEMATVTRKHRPSKKLKSGFVEHAQRATAMAEFAKNNGHQLAVYFHDTDGTGKEVADNPRLQGDITSAINFGFRSVEDAPLGVAMVPKPISEAWLICAVNDTPYQHCKALENLSGNDRAPDHKAPKKVLGIKLKNKDYTFDDMIEIAENIEPDLIDMDSYNQFRADLKKAVNKICGIEERC